MPLRCPPGHGQIYGGISRISVSGLEVATKWKKIFKYQHIMRKNRTFSFFHKLSETRNKHVETLRC